MGKVKILPCRSGRIFAERICNRLSEKYGWQNILGEVDVKEFKNLEVKPIVEDSIRGCSVYIVQNIDDPDSGRKPQENFDELWRLTDATRRSIGIYGHVSVIMPNYYGARQHRSKKREGIAARMVADILEIAGAEAVISADVHDEAIAGYFTRVKFDNLHASNYIIDFLRKNFSDFINHKIIEDNEEVCGLSVASPDAGGVKRAEYYAEKLKSRLVVGAKFKDEDIPNSVDKILLLGYIKNRNIFPIDDIVDTGTTLEKILTGLKKEEASDIYVGCTHPIFSGPAIEILTKLYDNGVIKGVIGTDSVIHLDKPEWYHEVSIAPLYGDVVYRIENNMSISELLR